MPTARTLLVFPACVALAASAVTLAPMEAHAQSCIEREKTLKAKIDSFNMESYKSAGKIDYDICAAMTDLMALVVDHTSHLEACPDANPTGEQRVANRTWISEMNASKAQYCG